MVHTQVNKAKLFNMLGYEDVDIAELRKQVACAEIGQILGLEMKKTIN